MPPPFAVIEPPRLSLPTRNLIALASYHLPRRPAAPVKAIVKVP